MPATSTHIDHWNYRVARYEAEGDQTFAVIAAYYDEVGLVTAWSHATPSGDTPDDVRTDLALMAAAFEKPQIAYADLPRSAERDAKVPF